MYNITDAVSVVEVPVFNAEQADKLKRYAAALVQEKQILGLVLNMRELRAVDSFAIGTLALLHKNLRKYQRMMAVCHVPPGIFSSLEMVGLDRVFNIYATDQDAITALNNEFTFRNQLTATAAPSGAEATAVTVVPVQDEQFNEVAYTFLRQSRYFEHVSDENLKRIVTLTEMRTFKQGDIIIEQGGHNRDVFFLFQGTASIIVDGNFIYNLQRSGDIFGEMGFMTGKPSSATIQSVTDVIALVIAQDVLSIVHKSSADDLHSVIYEWFTRILSDKLFKTSQKAKMYEALSNELQAQKDALAQSYAIIRKQQDQMDQELEQARETQKTLLPKKFPAIPQVTVVSKYLPMEQIGGDLYDVFPLGDNCFGFLMVDVTGHGIPAALVSFMVTMAFRSNVTGRFSTKEVIEKTNEALDGQLPNDKFATMFYGIYNAEDQIFTFTNGAHPDPLVIRPGSKEIFPLHTKGVPIGMFPAIMSKYAEDKITLQPGDKVLFYTDAVTEMHHPDKGMLGQEGLEKILSEQWDLPINVILEKLYEFGLSYMERTAYDDDFTLLGFEIFPS